LKYQLLSINASEDELRPIDIDRADAVIKAFRAIRHALREKDRLFRKLYGIRIESRAPRIAPGKVYTGQWVGIAEYMDRARGTLVRIAIAPKYRKFTELYRDTLRFLAENLRPLASLAMDLVYGCPSIGKDFRFAAWTLERYVETESPFTVKTVLSTRGHALRLRRGRVMLSRRISEVNEQLYSTILASLALLSRVVQDIRSSTPPELESLVKVWLEEQMKALQALLHKPIVQEALAYEHVGEVDETLLLQLLGSLKPIEVSNVIQGVTRALMIPSTKIYELYVLTKVIEVLGGAKSVHGIRRISTPRGIVYFNKPPKRLSRIVYRIAGSVPHPDIVVIRDGTAIVIDAKYRERLTKLELREVLRLIAYAADLARDSKFRVVVACLSKAIENIIAARLNDIEIEIVFVEVSPETGIAELGKAILD